eukprot:Skav203263  [mRNA]  locus=scaffold2987:32322:37461:- [translate_table: standard]
MKPRPCHGDFALAVLQKKSTTTSPPDGFTFNLAASRSSSESIQAASNFPSSFSPSDGLLTAKGDGLRFRFAVVGSILLGTSPPTAQDPNAFSTTSLASSSLLCTPCQRFIPAWRLLGLHC